jgi:uncharacterized protein YecE (DUF72 family)
MKTRKLHIGTMGWSYDFWKGNFYPKELESKEFLTYYSQQFDTVEVDNTFYRIPRKQTVIDWKEQTPADFLFSLKFPQIITHIKMLKDCREETDIFLERVELLQEKLGPLLLQFPFTFKNEHAPLLREFLKNLPRENRYAVEVRNRSLLNDNFYSILKESKVACAWVISPSLPLTERITSDFLYVRWEGDRKRVNGTLGKTEVDKSEIIKLWAHKLKQFSEGEKVVFGYFSKYFSGYPPSNVREFFGAVETK